MRARGLGSAEREGESGGAIGVAVGSGVGAVGDLAGVGDGAVDGMEVLADVAAAGDEEFAIFEGAAETREEFGFESGCEMAKLNAIGGGSKPPKLVGVVAELVFHGGTAAEFFLEVIAKADAGAGVIDGDALTALEVREQDLELFGSGEVAEGEDRAGQVLRVAECGLRISRGSRITIGKGF